MCGFLFTNFEVGLNKIEGAVNLINHRGPDNSNIIKIDNYYFAHKRLKILDLSDNSNQPIYSKNKKYLMLYNGEIYNFQEIAKKNNLELKNNSDTELLIELFSKKGINSLSELNGMFAIVFFDIEKKSFYVVRDRLGVKPLYYYIKDDGQFIFSSEINPILSLSNFKFKLDKIALRQAKRFRNFFDSRTIYDGISSINPGHYFFKNYQYQYWNLEPNENIIEQEEINFLIEDSIKIRKISDVEVGSFLSGGIDSSIITSVGAIKDTWSIGFNDHNEFKYIDIVKNHLKINNYKFSISHEDFLIEAENYIKFRNDLVLVPNEILISILSKKIKTKNTVVLSGEGADELFCGYDRIFRWAIQENWNSEKFLDLYCYGKIKDREIEDYVIKLFNKFDNNYYNISYFFQKFHLSGLLNRLDAATMYNSVEARSPFVDYRLIELLFCNDYKNKIDENDSKISLKKFSLKYLPNEIINRKKIGFPVLLDMIFKNNINSKNSFDQWIEYNLKKINLF